ncbi:MAG: hypothetical protein H6737_30560 [Alphaproteobacteria bacterium]|nr:hypothetical protein [Alphaproteobacteria bacterium]
MLWLMTTALAGPGVVVFGPDGAKALPKVEKATALVGLEIVEPGDLDLGEFLSINADFCSLSVEDYEVEKMKALHSDRPELWVATTGDDGMGLWKWDPGLQVLQRHVVSRGLKDQAADVLVLEWDGTAPELPKKALKQLAHSDVKVRGGEGTSGIAAKLMEQPAECIPSVTKEELVMIDGFVSEGRALYIAVVPPKGDAVLWRWQRGVVGLRRI